MYIYIYNTYIIGLAIKYYCYVYARRNYVIVGFLERFRRYIFQTLIIFYSYFSNRFQASTSSELPVSATIRFIGLHIVYYSIVSQSWRVSSDNIHPVLEIRPVYGRTVVEDFCAGRYRMSARLPAVADVSKMVL